MSTIRTERNRNPALPPRSAHMRVTQAEREQVVERLQQAFTDGRLDAGEFDQRLDLAMTARTRGDLAPLLADLTEAPTPPNDHLTVSGSERAWAMLSHLLVLCASFVGPLVVLLTKGNESAFIRDQAAEALNFQMTVLLVSVGLGFATALTFGLAALFYLPLAFAWFVLAFVSAIHSASGKAYRYPVNLRLVR